MEYVLLIIGIVLADFLTIITPGPDFIMTIRNTLLHGKKFGVATAVGITTGNAVHIIYCWIGVAAIIANSEVIFDLLKWFGAAYLIYFGVTSLLYKNSTTVDESEFKEDKDADKQKISTLKTAFLNGFFTNLFNPKAVLFYVSLYALVLTPETPLWVHGTLAFFFTLNLMVWFSVIALLFDRQRIRIAFMKTEKYVMRFMGGFLIVFGVKVMLSER